MSQVTKRALEASLKHLLLQKPLNKITINDIAEDCGINRMTFYYHFRDIYDLVEWACQEDARRILDGKRTYTTWQEGFRRILDGLIDNRPFILNVYRSVRREQVETFLFQVTHGLLMGVVEELDPRGEVREEDKAFLADFYKYAFVGLVLDWIRTGMKGEPAELARRVELVVSGSFAQALERLRPGDETSITGAPLLIAPPFRRGYTGPRIQSNAMKRRHFHVLFQRQLRGLCPPGEAGGRGA